MEEPLKRPDQPIIENGVDGIPPLFIVGNENVDTRRCNNQPVDSGFDKPCPKSKIKQKNLPKCMVEYKTHDTDYPYVYCCEYCSRMYVTKSAASDHKCKKTSKTPLPLLPRPTSEVEPVNGESTW